jgi:large subunit ribosomal protein L21
MYAIIEESGSQRKVAEGEVVLVDLLEAGEAKPGRAVTFGKVLVVGRDGAEATIGQPYVKGASVTGEVVEPLVKGEKLAIHKFRTKKAFKKKTGHRQQYTSVRITGISG